MRGRSSSKKEFMSMLPGSLATCLSGGGGHGCEEEEAEEELVR